MSVNKVPGYGTTFEYASNNHESCKNKGRHIYRVSTISNLEEWMEKLNNWGHGDTFVQIR